MRSRNNSFDLIRHFAALLVLYSHHFALSGLPQPIFLNWDTYTYGFVAVVIFFTISGYFMPASFTNSGDFVVFMSKRCRRIFPGLIVCSIIMCYLIGGIFTPEPGLKYLLSSSTFEMCMRYIAFLGRPIDGVFSDFIYKDAINGSLWTLPVEFAWYIILGTALSYLNNWKSVSTLFIMSLVTLILLKINKIDYSFYSVPLSWLTMFGLAFTAGAFMSMTQKSWINIKMQLLIISLIILVFFKGRPELTLLGTVALAVITIVIGISFKDKLINGRFDISYGIYIYAFPVQQIIINLVTQRFWLSMIISTIVTACIAYLSYRFVEKPALYINRKSKQPLETTLVT